MNYKRLGDYIQQVNVRNTDLKDLPLLGVSISKNLISSIANIIGTDMSSYKIIKKGQFAYGTVTSRNGDKISIALANEHEQALISQIYIVFEVIDKEKLLPEYLMMWFSRPEFDRYARYHSHGSTRETFDWADMCEVMLPIPNIETQRHIVAQYQAIEQKIKTNEALCEKLEATAQALYKHWFVDEVDKNNITTGELFIAKKGKNITREKAVQGIYPVVAGGLEPSCYHNKYNTSSPVVTISASGANAGFVRLYHTEVWASDCSYIDENIFEQIYFVYVCIKFNQSLLMSKQEGTGQPHIYPEHIATIPIQKYSIELVNKFNEYCKPLFSKKGILEKQSQTLKKLQSLLLSRMAGVVEKGEKA